MVGRALILVAGMAFAVVGSKHAGAVQKPVEPGPAAQAELVQTYCGTCHGDKTRSGGVSLERADLVDVPKGAETWEKVIRKVRAGMMPPPGAPRPDAAKLDAFAGYLESSLDRQAAAKPRPGRTTMHRLNRAEYANAIRDLLALDVDSAALLPPDDESSGFDNIADVLTVSPSLMERYLSASWTHGHASSESNRIRQRHPRLAGIGC